MSKLWLVALNEYRRHVLRKRFIMVMLSVPLISVLMVGMVALTVSLTENNDPVGYVDHAGFLSDPLPAPLPGGAPTDFGTPRQVSLLPFESEAAAQSALESGEIQAFYVIAADFETSKATKLVYTDRPGGDVRRQFWDFVQVNRLDDLDPETASRAVAGTNLLVRWPDDAPGGGREFSRETFLDIFIPLLTGFAFVFTLFSASGYLMGAIVEEKENRTIEVVTTSISSNQLIGGKVLGIILVTLTQLTSWIVLSLLVVYVGANLFHISALQHVRLDPSMILTMVAVAAPAFIMLAGLMTAVGAVFTESQEAQQMTGVFVFPFMIPIYFLQPIMEHPDSPLVLILSLLPPTSVATYSLRLGFSQVPTWQILTSVTITSLCAAAAVWIAGRAFRLGMLRYGKRLSLREIFGREQIPARGES